MVRTPTRRSAGKQRVTLQNSSAVASKFTVTPPARINKSSALDPPQRRHVQPTDGEDHGPAHQRQPHRRT